MEKLFDGLIIIIVVLTSSCGFLLYVAIDQQNQYNTSEAQIRQYQNQINQVENQNGELEKQIDDLENQIVDLQEEVNLKRKAEEGVIEITNIETNGEGGNWQGVLYIHVSVKNYGCEDVDGLVVEARNSHSETADDTQVIGLLKAGGTKTVTLRGEYNFWFGTSYVVLMLNGEILDTEGL